MAKKEDKKDPTLVGIFSKREGDIICSDGTVLKFEQITHVKKEIAEWLFKSFPGLLLKVD